MSRVDHAVRSLQAFAVIAAVCNGTPITQAQQPAAPTVAEIRQQADKYNGRSVTVGAAVQEVLGPRMFRVTGRQPADAEGTLLVLMPPALVATVTAGRPVTLTGTVRILLQPEARNTGVWFDIDATLQRELTSRPVIVADVIRDKAGSNLAVRVEPDRRIAAVGGHGSPITDLHLLAQATDDSFVGRTVDIQQGEIMHASTSGGFWLRSGGEHLFVIPAEPVRLAVGQAVGVSGIVLAFPQGMKARSGESALVRDEHVYVLATQLKR